MNDLGGVMTLNAPTRTPPEVRTDGLADCIPNGIRQDFIADVLFEQPDYLVQFADQERNRLERVKAILVEPFKLKQANPGCAQLSRIRSRTRYWVYRLQRDLWCSGGFSFVLELLRAVANHGSAGCINSDVDQSGKIHSDRMRRSTITTRSIGPIKIDR
jgi:hypothetical protein